MDMSESMDALESEDALFLKKEIIGALKRSEENDEKMEKFLQQNLRFSRSTISRDELSHRENERRR